MEEIIDLVTLQYDRCLDKICNGKYLINDEKFKNYVLVFEKDDNEEESDLNVIDIVRKCNEYNKSKQEVYKIITDE